MSGNDAHANDADSNQKESQDINGGGASLSVDMQDVVGLSGAVAKRGKEVFLTQEQAKQKKLQKGYVLEPVTPKASDSQSLSQKRERKKSYHFGYSPTEDDDASSGPRSTGSEGGHRHKHKPHSSNGSVKGAAVGTPAPSSNLPSQWVEKRKILQARLKRLEAQLAKVREASASVAANSLQTGTYASSSRCATPPVEGGHHLSRQASATWGNSFLDAGSPAAMDRRPSDATAPLSAKRKAASDRLRSDPKRLKASDGENRLVPAGRMRNAHQHCVKLLDTLMRDRASKAYFNTPVDYVALGIPLYPQIISHPMDLGTVKQRLDDGEYESVEAWAADIKLVWSNAMTFNAEGNDVHECAKGLAVSFDKMLKQFPKIAGAPLASLGASSAPSGGDGGARHMLELKRTMEKLQQEVASLKSKPPTAAATQPPKKKSGGSNSARKAMSFDEKRNLSLNINKLDNDKLIKVVEIIKKRKGHMVGESAEVEIDIDALDNHTLRELDKYVNECLNPRPQAPSKAGGAAARKPGRPNGAPPAAQRPAPAATPVARASGDGWPPAGSSDSDSDSDSDDSDTKTLPPLGGVSGAAGGAQWAAGGGGSYATLMRPGDPGSGAAGGGASAEPLLQ